MKPVIETDSLLEASSVTAAFFATANRLKESPCLFYREQSLSYKAFSWAEASQQVKALGSGLQALGVRKGDRVAILSLNHPLWALTDMAIMSIGGVSVPVYTVSPTEDWLYILKDSGARGIVVRGAEYEQSLSKILHQSPCEWIVGLSSSVGVRGKVVRYTLQEVIERGKKKSVLPPPVVCQEDLACLIYTSGSTGVPRGVMLTHGALLHNCWGAATLLREIYGHQQEVFLSFLPLAHAYERTVGQLLPLLLGHKIYYVLSLQSISKDIQASRPTFFLVVPRLLEVMRSRIQQGAAQSSKLSRYLFLKTLALGRKRLGGKKIGGVERCGDFILEQLVRRRFRKRFGGRLRAFCCGGAALDPEIVEFFLSLGVQVLQGYGLSEAGPIVSVQHPRNLLDGKFRSVGPPLPGVKVKILKGGEIAVSSRSVMQGYWKKPQESAQVLKKGWLKTGDLGALDEEGVLTITDRLKDIIVLQGGDNVSPVRVEEALMREEEIAQACVFGNDKKFLVALLVPADSLLEQGEAVYHKALSTAMAMVCQSLSAYERPRRFFVVKEPFSLENRLLTPTLKMKRRKIFTYYQKEIEALYG